MTETNCWLMDANAFFATRKDSRAMYLYFRQENLLARADKNDPVLNHECDILQEILKGAINTVEDENGCVFLKTQAPIFVDDESEWHYLGISVIDEPMIEFISGMSDD